MSEFKKGQLVAVRDGDNEDWTLRVYDHTSSEGLIFCRWLVHPALPYPTWSIEAKPAEEVWPDIFLGWERSAREQAADAVAMESALVQRLRKQIAWLCQELAHADDLCPTLSMTAPCDHACAYCWEQASLKAVEEGGDDAG